MRILLLLAASSLALAGCETIHDVVWSENTYLNKKENTDGYVFESYITDTHNNFDGTHAGIRYDFYVTNNTEWDLCFKVTLDNLQANSYEYGSVYRITPGASSWLAYAAVFNATGNGFDGISFTVNREWAWVDADTDCQDTNL